VPAVIDPSDFLNGEELGCETPAGGFDLLLRRPAEQASFYQAGDDQKGCLLGTTVTH
jgi:hypothetical protein